MGRVGKDREISIMPEQSTGAASATAPSREHFASRLGFILISAGCAIGLGNVWRFPYITGQYGGAAFFLIYLVFLVILGLPVMVMEFAVGRASQKSAAQAFDRLQPSGAWHWFSWWGYIGCTVLMMFYTTVCGWMLSYVPKMASGVFGGADAQATAAVFSDMLADPVGLIAWMVVAVAVGAVVCGMGLQKGVERITKWMMATLFVVMLVLCVRAVTLPGAGEGIAFYLVPDFSRLFAGATAAEQWATFSDAVFAAMGQALFSLSLGMASMEIFGSYIGRERSLTGEAISVTALNTVVAVLAGLIIFPACFAYGVSPDQGPSRDAACGVRADAFGKRVGRAVLRVHEFCRALDGDCRVREPHQLVDRQVGHYPSPCCRDHGRSRACAVAAVRARVQRSFRRDRPGGR